MDDSWEWRFDRSLGCFVRPGRRPGSQERWWPDGQRSSVVRAYFFDPRTGLRGLPPPEPVAAGAPGPDAGGDERDDDPDGRLAWGL